MRRIFVFMIAAVLLIAAVFPVCAHAEEGDPRAPLNAWLKKHPNTAYCSVNQDTKKSFVDKGYITAETFGTVVKLFDNDTHEVAYLFVDTTGEGYLNADRTGIVIKYPAFSESTGISDSTGQCSAHVSVSINFIGEAGYEGYDPLEEFYRNRKNEKELVDQFNESVRNTKDPASVEFYDLEGTKYFESITINDKPAYVTTWECCVDKNSVSDRYNMTKTYSVFLEEICPGLSLELGVSGKAHSGVHSLDKDKLNVPSPEKVKEDYSNMCFQMESWVNEYLYRDYSVSYRVLTDNGFLTGNETVAVDEPDEENTDIVIHTEAGDEEGIEVSEVIPAVVIGGGVIGIGGALISKGSKKKKNANKKKEEKKEEKEEEKQSTYRMVLYKDFGSILMMGDVAKKVCARIEEVTPDGVVKERNDLTSAIVITGAENIRVESTGIDGKYKYAMVKVQSDVRGTIPNKAVVRFFYQGAGGSFANNVSFNVFAPLIEFNADGLCFIAQEKQTFELPFDILVPEGVIMPIDGLAFNVEVPDSSDFEASVITAEEGFEVRVTDTSSKKYYAGYAQEYVITVKAIDDSGEVIAEGAFPAARFCEGLRLSLNDIKCYLIDAGYNPEEKYTDDPNVKKSYATTRVDVCLYAYDRENNCMRNPVLQESDIRFTFEDVEDSCDYYDQLGNGVDSFCELLDFRYKLRGVAFSDNTAVGMISPGKGLLMPPTRFKAKVTCEVTWQGTTYTDTKTVLCASQKRRIETISEDMPTMEYLRACTELTDPYVDEKKTEKLKLMMKNVIMEDYKFNRMLPFTKKIKVMLLGYDSTYGYYEPDYKRVCEAYIKWLNGEFTPAEVNKRIFDTGDENYWSDFGNYMFYNSTESGWGTAVRIGCGILTCGASEWVYMPIEVYNKMEGAYVYENKSAGETIGIGAVTVINNLIMGKAMEKIAPYAGKLLEMCPTFTKYAKQVKDFISKHNMKINCVDNMKEEAKKIMNKSKLYRDSAEKIKSLYNKYNVNIEFSSGGISLNEKQASKTLDEITSQAEKEAKNEIIDFRKNYDLDDTEKIMSEAYSRSRQDGLVKVKNFRDALSEGGEKAGQAALEIGSQKTALRQADEILTRTEKGQLYRLRKDYVDAGTDAIKEGLMRERGIAKDKLSIEFVSSKSEAELLGGAKVNSDFDINVYYTAEDGKKILMDSRLYKDYFTEAYCRKAGIDAASRIEREYVLRGHDITLMDKNCADYLGEEVAKITNKNLRGAKFENPDAMFNGYRNKMVDPHYDALEALKEADALERAGFNNVADDLRQLASRCEGEGHRTIGKAYDVVIEGRLREAIVQGNAPAKAKILNIRKKVAVIKESEKMLDPGEVDAFFRKKYGQSYEEVVDEINSFGKQVNEGLGDYSGRLWNSYTVSKIRSEVTKSEIEMVSRIKSKIEKLMEEEQKNADM